MKRHKWFVRSRRGSLYEIVLLNCVLCKSGLKSSQDRRSYKNVLIGVHTSDMIVGTESRLKYPELLHLKVSWPVSISNCKHNCWCESLGISLNAMRSNELHNDICKNDHIPLSATLFNIPFTTNPNALNFIWNNTLCYAVIGAYFSPDW